MEMSWRSGCQNFVFDTGSSSHGGQRQEHQSLEQMVLDIVGPSFISNDMDIDYEADYEEAPEAEEPNSEFQKLKKMIDATHTPLWDPCRPWKTNTLYVGKI